MEAVVKARNVRLIPKKIDSSSIASSGNFKQKRVCAYARVSTDSEEQATSYNAQVDYYTNLIKQKPNWIYVDTFADEGISGTSTKKRDGFNKMISEALAGKIDLIITKSISRFARNTVDTLQTIRKLKEHNVEVFFEKENIYSLDGKGEVMLSILSSLAQEESRSISANTTWGIRKQFADGKVKLSTKYFLGYDRDDDGKLIVNKEQAEVIRLIYKMYLMGDSTWEIKKKLERMKIKSPAGKDIWRVNTVVSILTNEKFKGDALLQKYYTVDFLTKKKAVNKGEVTQYYVTDDHEAIIDKKTFDAVQVEIKNRKRGYSGLNEFNSRVICGECGASYGRYIWHSNQKNRKIVYRCNHKYSNDIICKSKAIEPDRIKKFFVDEFNKINKSEHYRNIKIAIDTLCDTTAEEEKLQKLIKKRDEIIEKDNKLMETFSTSGADCTAEHDKLSKEFEKTQNEISEVEAKISEKNDKKKSIELYESELKKAPKKITEFDNVLFAMLVDKIIVHKDKTLEMVWKGNA